MDSNADRGDEPDHAVGDPRPAAVTFVTTEHFTLQGARSSTISESTSRASVFLGAVSGGGGRRGAARAIGFWAIRTAVEEDER